MINSDTIGLRAVCLSCPMCSGSPHALQGAPHPHLQQEQHRAAGHGVLPAAEHKDEHHPAGGLHG